MALVAIVAALALIQYVLFLLDVGRARAQYEVVAPAITGHEQFERRYRVQQNTLEQLIVFLPSLYLFAAFVGPRLAAALGVAFLVGRGIYRNSYVADPARRGLGFQIGGVATVVLLLGGLLGALRALF